MLLVAAMIMMALVTADGWGVVELTTKMQCSRHSHHQSSAAHVCGHATNGMVLLKTKPVYWLVRTWFWLAQLGIFADPFAKQLSKVQPCHAYLSTVANLLQSIALNGTHS